MGFYIFKYSFPDKLFNMTYNNIYKNGKPIILITFLLFAIAQNSILAQKQLVEIKGYDKASYNISQAGLRLISCEEEIRTTGKSNARHGLHRLPPFYSRLAKPSLVLLLTKKFV